ncbi:MAG: vitamin K epoxide reductase, partial [Hymenobacteraceae bacterium]|nr:vitamin K epoxide reductase [Hymenobacteraceae bacterium]
SDAGLGTIAYTFEFLMGWMGSPARWRTMPWMVAVFGILVIPLGLVHIFLVISQPVVVGAWCTFCLLAAAIMLPMIPLEADEVIAMIQFVKKKMQQGEKFWKLFWKGGTIEGGEKEEHAPELMKFPQEPGKVYAASIWGMSFPWTLTVSMLLGVAMVFAPGVFGVPIQDTVADVLHLTGSLVVVVSVICMGEPMRTGRYLNVLLGLVAAGVPWFLDGPTALNVTGLVLGLAVAALAIPLGPKTQDYAGWDEYIK